mmetsp:Transcript_1073/g.4449  ORF Transcript_1073/g.4449 Transcript_1073/m.4449 type:complete len:290 (+) Transcript_1073:277-1146(+)
MQPRRLEQLRGGLRWPKHPDVRPRHLLLAAVHASASLGMRRSQSEEWIASTGLLTPRESDQQVALGVRICLHVEGVQRVVGVELVLGDDNRMPVHDRATVGASTLAQQCSVVQEQVDHRVLVTKQGHPLVAEPESVFQERYAPIRTPNKPIRRAQAPPLLCNEEIDVFVVLFLLSILGRTIVANIGSARSAGTIGAGGRTGASGGSGRECGVGIGAGVCVRDLVDIVIVLFKLRATAQLPEAHSQLLADAGCDMHTIWHLTAALQALQERHIRTQENICSCTLGAPTAE